MPFRLRALPLLRRSAAATLAVSTWAVPAHAAPPVEITTPHFIVYSDAGEAAARDAAERAERVRGTFARVWPWARVATGAPIYLFVSDREGVRSVLPAGTKNADAIPGWYTHGPERHYFVARTDPKGGSAMADSALFSGYATLVLEQSFARPPLWLVSGVSQLFAQTLLKPDATVEFGHPLPWLKWVKGKYAPVSLADMFATKRWSDLNVEQTAAFNTTCWALAHWLVVDQTLAANRAVGQFLTHLAEGVPSAEALRRAGLDASRVDAAVKAYLAQNEFRVVSLPVAAPDRSSWRVREISRPEWQAVSALYFVELGRGPAAASAESRVREVLRFEPASPLAHEALARALWLQSKWPEAREHLQEAVKASPDRLSSHFLAAYLERDLSSLPEATADGMARGLEHARRAVELGPEFAPAHAVLADLLLKTGAPPAEALALARRAVALEPSQPALRLVLATALARSGNSEAARQECRDALANDVEDGLRKQFEALAASLASAPAPPPK